MKLNHLLFLLVIGSFQTYTPLTAALGLWSLPIENEMKTLKVQNLKAQPQSLWLQGPAANKEKAFQIPAAGSLEIPLREFSSFPWLQLKTDQNQSLKLQLKSAHQIPIRLFEGSTTKWKIPAGPATALILFNQAPFTQKIRIRALNRIQETVELEAYEKKKIALSKPLQNRELRLIGEARFGGLAQLDNRFSPLVPDSAPVSLQPRSELYYFRLSNREHTQSYLVALDDMALVEQARNQIANPDTFLPRILIAQISYGHNEFNRDFSSRTKAAWSWHISRVFRFAELASQECDGSPQFIEENLQYAVEGKGLICFWNYRILEELDHAQVASGRK